MQGGRNLVRPVVRWEGECCCKQSCHKSHKDAPGLFSLRMGPTLWSAFKAWEGSAACMQPSERSSVHDLRECVEKHRLAIGICTSSTSGVLDKI